MRALTSMDKVALEARLQKLTELHRALGEELVLLREQLSRPAPSQPVAADQVETKPTVAPKQDDPLLAARQEILEGYQVDAGVPADDLLYSVILRLLQGDANGMKDKSLPAARLIACHLIEASGLRASTRWSGSRLAKLFIRQVPFTPIRSIRRLPR